MITYLHRLVSIKLCNRSVYYRLRRVLRGIGWLYPDLGYCQGVGVIAAILLLLLEEEDAFWLLCAIVEDLLPASYYTPSLIGNSGSALHILLA